nr:MAG TPA_asm: hypothetical protein [Caudoviricetes sp.]
MKYISSCCVIITSGMSISYAIILSCHIHSIT